MQEGDARALGALFAAGVEALRAAGIASARLDARILLQAATGCRPEDVILEPTTEIAAGPAAVFRALLDRRAGHEPVSRILGRREFWSLSLELGPAALDPRPDSETLVAAALEASDSDAPGCVLDLGTGSGCLLIAVLSERPRMRGIGIDCSPAAVRIAASNARRLGMADRTSFLAGDWVAPIRGKFDLILCNPPYIETGALGELAREVRDFEPRAALDGGPDGLAAYRALAPTLGKLLAPQGMALFEIGHTQADAAKGIFINSGFTIHGLHADLAGRPRCLAVGLGMVQIENRAWFSGDS
jgi:release factor glutamine methyltransferase